MTVHLLTREQRLSGSPDAVFPFFAAARNLEAITPPWLGFHVRTPEPIAMAPGTLIAYRLELHGLPLRWLTRIEEWVPGVRFVDAQVRGPYALWHHTHEFAPATGPDGLPATVMRDTVRYALPLGLLGEVARRAFVARDLARIFDYRAEAVARMLAAGDSPAARAAQRRPAAQPSRASSSSVGSPG